MRKTLLSALITCFVAIGVSAQTPFTTMDSVNVNNINAAVLVHGDLWWNPTTGIAHCNFPNGAPTNISSAGGVWMSGYDAAGQLHAAAQTYRQDGNDYWPGPLDASDTLTYATSQAWAKIWKVNRLDIQYFQSLTVHDTINTPEAILTWPAAGNTYARGNGGAPLSFVPGNSYAPFVDLNSNGIYEPLLGEYPDVPGDQALWWVFSDNGPTHTQTNGVPLGVEVQAMAYAYHRGTLIDNVVYYRYRIVNHSSNTYDNFRFGQWAIVELGDPRGDDVGFDSFRRMAVVYNGDDCDGCTDGNLSSFYGNKIPVAGITMVVLPGDSPPMYIPAGSFDYYNDDFSIAGNPSNAVQVNAYLRALGGIPTPLPGQPCIPRFSDSTGPPSNYAYTGDPSVPDSWSECQCGIFNAGDQRFILSSNDFTVLPGSSTDVVLALVTTNPDSLNGCPNASFDSINIIADTAWAIYYNPLPQIDEAVGNVTAVNMVCVYPNPANDLLFITGTGKQAGAVSITVYNTLGQLINLPVSTAVGTSTLDIHLLPPAMYYLIYRDGIEQQCVKFIKE